MKVLKSETHYIENKDIILKVKSFASHHVETIILLHGGPGVPDKMEELVCYFSKKFQVILFDQRGVGDSYSASCDFRLEHYISDLNIISKKFKLNTFHLFGHSWGGLYALIYAQQKPEKIRSLFLCSPSSGTNATWKKMEKEVLLYHKNKVTFYKWFQMGWFSFLGMMGSDKAYGKLFNEVMYNYLNKYSLNNTKEEINKSLGRINAKAINKTRKEILKYPTLNFFNQTTFSIIVTYGSDDIYLASKEELISKLKSADFRIIPKCGHIPWKNNANSFKNILNEYYNS